MATAADHGDIETGVAGRPPPPLPPPKPPSAQTERANRPLQLMAREWVQWRLALSLVLAPIVALFILIVVYFAVGLGFDAIE